MVFGDGLEDSALLRSSSTPLELGNGSGSGITVPGVQCKMVRCAGRARATHVAGDRDYAPMAPTLLRALQEPCAPMTTYTRRPFCSTYPFTVSSFLNFALSTICRLLFLRLCA